MWDSHLLDSFLLQLVGGGSFIGAFIGRLYGSLNYCDFLGHL